MIEIKDSVTKIYRKPALYFIIVSFFLVFNPFLYIIEEIKNKIFKRRRFKTNEEVSSCSGIKVKMLTQDENRHRKIQRWEESGHCILYHGTQ